MIWIAILSTLVRCNALPPKWMLAFALVITFCLKRLKRMIQNNKILMRSKIAIWLVVALPFMVVLSCGAGKPLATTTKVAQDTTHIEQIRKVDYRPMAGLNLAIGKSLTIPGLKLKVTRISATEALVESQTEVIKQTTTEVQLVATKQVDRSKDKSISDSQVGNKQKTDIDTKEKKANNEKVKENNKQVRRSSGWLIWLFVVVSAFIFIRFRLWELVIPKSKI